MVFFNQHGHTTNLGFLASLIVSMLLTYSYRLIGWMDVCVGHGLVIGSVNLLLVGYILYSMLLSGGLCGIIPISSFGCGCYCMSDTYNKGLSIMLISSVFSFGNIFIF